MSATNQCIIEEFLIHSDRRKEGEKPFDLAPFIVAVDYFEDIFSPCVTLKVLILNESQVVTEDEEDTEALPYVCQKVSIYGVNNTSN